MSSSSSLCSSPSLSPSSALLRRFPTHTDCPGSAFTIVAVVVVVVIERIRVAVARLRSPHRSGKGRARSKGK